MAVVRCSACNAPLTSGESQAGKCPVCGTLLGRDNQSTSLCSALAGAVPGRRTMPAKTGRGWLWCGAALTVLVLGIVSRYGLKAISVAKGPDEIAAGDKTVSTETATKMPAGNDKPAQPVSADKPKEPAMPAVAPTPEQEASKKPAEVSTPKDSAAAVPIVEPNPEPVREAPKAELAVKKAEIVPPAGGVIPSSKEAARSPKKSADPAKDPPQEPIAPGSEVSASPAAASKQPEKPETKEPEKDPAILPLGGGTTIDKPDGEYVLPVVNGHDDIRLSGKVKTLKVTAANGNAVLDASGLEAKEIFVAEAINGEATVVLNAPGGSVEIRGGINGPSKLMIVAPGGKVKFVEGAQIQGVAELTIAAAEVEFADTIAGAPKVDVTLTKGGKLKFKLIAGAARLHYKKADPKDPELTVEAGTVKEAAEVKQIQP